MIDLTPEQFDDLQNSLVEIAVKLQHFKAFRPDGTVDVEKFHEFYQSNVDVYVKTSEDPVACKKGCFYCCSLHVDTFPGEMKYILDRYKEEYGEANYKKVVFKAELRHRDTKELSAEQQRAHKKLCPFLKGTLCSIYEYRPMSCRSMVVANTPDLCKQSYDQGTDEVMPFLGKPKLLQAFMSMALLMQLEQLNLEQAIQKTLSDQDSSWKSMQEAIVEYSKSKTDGEKKEANQQV